jgi:hypothetical protein
MSHRAQFGVFISSGLQFVSASPLRRTHTPPTTKVKRPQRTCSKTRTREATAGAGGSSFFGGMPTLRSVNDRSEDFDEEPRKKKTKKKNEDPS